MKTRINKVFSITGGLRITAMQLALLRALPDFDLRVIIAEIHENGWPVAVQTLICATEAIAKNKGFATNTRQSDG